MKKIIFPLFIAIWTCAATDLPLSAAQDNAAAADKPAPGECNKKLLRKLHVNPEATVGPVSWYPVYVKEKDNMDEQTKTLLQYGNGQLCDKAVWDAIPGGQAAYDKQRGLDKIGLILNAAATVRKSKNPEAGAAKPKSSAAPIPAAGTDAASPDDRMEKAVAEFMLTKKTKRTQEEDALLTALKTDPAHTTLGPKWRGEIVSEINTNFLGPTNLAAFLASKKISHDDVMAYICPKRKMPAPVAELETPKAKPQAEAMVPALQSNGLTTAMDALKAGSAAGFEVSPVFDNLCGKYAQNTAVNNTPAGSSRQPAQSSDLSRQPDVPSVPGGGPGNLTAGGDDKKDSGLFNLDGNGKRDSAVFGVLTGGVFGLLALGAAAGPAGILAAVLIGGLIGFFGYAATHPKKDKE